MINQWRTESHTSVSGDQTDSNSICRSSGTPQNLPQKEVTVKTLCPAPISCFGSAVWRRFPGSNGKCREKNRHGKLPHDMHLELCFIAVISHSTSAVSYIFNGMLMCANLWRFRPLFIRMRIPQRDSAVDAHISQ